MAFCLTPSETFKQEVKVQTKTATGAWREESFVGVFKRTPEDDRERRLKLSNIELLREVLVDWEMKDLETREEVPFTESNFEAFLRLTGAVREASIAYWNGNVGAKQKN